VTAADLLLALEPVVAALEALGVRYYVGGSLASSAHGVPRASIDADVIADLHEAHVERLMARLQGYYVDEGRVRSAVQARRSFNAIHLATMFKIDVFVAKGRPFDDEISDRQWADIVGMLKTGAERLDYGYLERWAGLLAVRDLLQRARQECEPGT
jgi:hypothetical protein